MVQTVLQESHYGHDLPLGVSLKVQDRLEGMAPDWPESPAAVALRELQQVAGEALPEDSAELFAALLAKSQDELVRLLAVCVASTVDVVTPRATPATGAELAQAVGLDMAMVEADREGYQHCRRPRFWKPWASSPARHPAGEVEEGRHCQRSRTAGRWHRLDARHLQGRRPAGCRASGPEQDAPGCRGRGG
jgi:ParB family chromosome partitioning protein